MTDATLQVPRDVRSSGHPAKVRKAVMAHKRRTLLLILAGAILVFGLLWWFWSAVFGVQSQSTENAYTNVELAQVTPLVGGPVRRVAVTNTQAVRAGQVLLEIDDTDLRLAVAQAEAALGHAKRQVRQVLANDDNLAGQIAVRSADVASAQADLAKAEANLDKAALDERRRSALAGPGAISAQEYSDAQTLTRDARAGVALAQARVTAAQAATRAAAGARHANEVLFEDATVETHPDVLAAKARLDQARIDLARAVVRAPIDGVVDQRKVAVGQRVQPGVPVMVVVPVQSLYVDANFKEGQLREVRPGQAATLTSDLYGSKVIYHGRVEGFAGGSGSAFAAIPAQNATGNWIKVVQRLPVRISLDPAELRAHPLRVGLSMHAEINLSGGDRHVR
jgi:membrane fusion protein (multidrug efflux system)